MPETAYQASPITIVAILTPRTGALARFREFETKAASIMARHGGVIERTAVIESPGPLREVHWITFPDRESFEGYRVDADLVALAEMRAACIETTEVLVGREGPRYEPPDSGKIVFQAPGR